MTTQAFTKLSTGWKAAALIIVENPKRAGWALTDAFGEQHAQAWRDYRELFDDDGMTPAYTAQEQATAYCLMAAVLDWDETAAKRKEEEAKRERRDRILNPTPDLDDDDWTTTNDWPTIDP